MGKKGVLLDNGKTAQSSMSLYWKASHNRSQSDKAAKKEAREEDIESRAESNLDKWKLHKQKMINKLYQKLESKEKTDNQADKEKQRKEEQQLQKDLLDKQLNKNKPVTIPGFKNASQLKAKMQFQQVVTGRDDNNTLKARNPGEELTHQEIVQILREKKAKKEMERTQKARIQNNLQKRQIHADIMMDGIPQDKQHVFQPQKKQQSPKPQAVETPQNFFKSQILQKIERGQSLRPKQERPSQEQPAKKEEQPRSSNFVSQFIPRALWQK